MNYFEDDPTQLEERTIKGIKLVLTCGACPEQYDAFKNGVQVGYLRLRHGSFYVDFLDCGGETIYEAEPKGDGMFESEERVEYLTKAVDAILEALKTHNNKNTK